MKKSLLSAGVTAAVFVAVFLMLVVQSRVEHFRIHGGTASGRNEAAELLRGIHGDNLILLNIAGLQRKLRTLPGVGGAEVRRRLPDTLEVQLSARRALAVWDGGGLVDSKGRRYGGTANEWLPIFRGTPGRAASMAAFYGEAELLLLPLGAGIAQLQVDDNGEWSVFLQNGVVLQLGRENRHARLRRYAAHANELNDRFAGLRAVDLRYEKGFAVRMALPETETINTTEATKEQAS